MSAGATTVPLVGRPKEAVADPEGLKLSRRVTRRITYAELIAGFLGAADVFVLLWFVLPTPDTDADRTTILVVNLAAVIGILVVTGIGGTLIGRRMAQPIHRWLAAGRPPTDRERAIVLRQPLQCAVMDAVAWTASAFFFFGLNAIWSVELGAHIASVIFLGGLTVTGVIYLLVERLMRPVTARALAYGPPKRRMRVGVKTRLILVWLSATGVPLFGLMLVGIHALAFGGATADQLAVTAIAMGGLAGGAGLLATYLAAKSVADPLKSVRQALGLIEQGDLDAHVPVDDASEIGLVQSGVNRMATGLRERERLRDLFGRHVGEDVAAAALDTDRIELGGEVREVAVLFIDLVGSTALAATRPPREVVRVLNDFFAVVVDVVGKEGGWVNKFEGDAALCVWGAPAGHDDCAAAALTAARTLHDRLSRKGIDAGIGVSAGPAVAGNVGAEHRFEYTVIGDPVNEAARLCDLAKRRDERVVASEAILKRCRNGEAARWAARDEVTLRGRGKPTRLAVPA
jgi:adenylate cyclase